ncbi:MAG: enoyl-CoA hydratase/isomerase family protein [Deltaproteobacteria bacterium]|nr:enoyl-CoA hydratase/isomerase family protein [Deltaproteobacteria bacterium]
MQYSTIIYSEDQGIAIITLNRPEVLNSLNEQLLDELEDVLELIERNAKIRVVIVSGHNDFFCAGADIRMLKEWSSILDAHSFLVKIQRVINKFETIPQPVIAAVSGIALGGGTEISLACDLRIAAENAVFGQPEISLGIIPGAGGTQRLPRTVGLTVAKELLFTGRRVKAEEALQIRLINKIVPIGELMNAAIALARQIAEKPLWGVRMTKTCLMDGLQMNLSQALAYEGRCFEFLTTTDDHREGIAAFLEKRKPSFTGN